MATTMNQISSILTDEEYAELRRRPGFKDRCPTCNGVGHFSYDGNEYECELDADEIHIQFKLHRLYELANLPLRYQRLNWKDFNLHDAANPEIKIEVDRFVDHKSNAINNGLGLYIHSETLGTGKTFIATHILKECVKAGYKGYYIPFFDILSLYQLHDEEREFIEAKMMTSPLVVIDDVTVGVASDKQAAHFSQTLERFVRRRGQNSLSTIITSNLTQKELDRHYNRIFSLSAESMMPLELPGTFDARIELGFGRQYNMMLNGEVPPIT